MVVRLRSRAARVMTAPQEHVKPMLLAARALANCFVRVGLLRRSLLCTTQRAGSFYVQHGSQEKHVQ